MNDWFFDMFHDDAENRLGLDRAPEVAVLIMFVLAGLITTFALLVVRMGL